MDETNVLTEERVREIVREMVGEEVWKALAEFKRKGVF